MNANQQQHEHWNQGEAMHWVEQADRYDRQLEPFARLLLDAARITAEHDVLDVGCGCGATTIAAAHVARHATGADISAPMLDVARGRAAEFDNCDFVLADVQTADLGTSAYDRIISRFGVMFFDDPAAAFARLHAALRAGGRLAFVSWQPLVANEWLFVPGVAAAAHVALPDVGDDGGPGMFSLSDPERLHVLLTGAGFTDVNADPIEPSIQIGGGGTLDDTLDFLLGTGIARALLEPADPEARALAIDAVREALRNHYQPNVGVTLGTGAWLVTASA